MSTIFLRRTGIFNKNGLVIMRLYRKDGKLQISEQTNHTFEKICSRKYAEMKNEQLRINITDIRNVEKTRLPSQRVWDISGNCINIFSCTYDKKKNNEIPFDPDTRIENYNCSGLLNLSSSMQTSVPYPFQVELKITHLNMPRGQLRQQAKYVSEQLQSFHYRSFSTEKRVVEEKIIEDSQKQYKEPTKKLTLKSAVKEYGLICLFIHITLSLSSLGIIYFLVYRGIDVEGILKDWDISEGATAAGTAGPFVIAYVVHKTLAPFRISLTLLITSILMKYRHNWGFKLKKK